jgi:soluble lytic murein transglycosylase
MNIPSFRPALHALAAAAVALLCALPALPVAAAAAAPGPNANAPGDELMLRARDALRRGDTATLASARNTLVSSGHPLAPWADYLELNQRLAQASQPELDAFYARWPGSYVEDRLRNDWLLELGKRRDWVNFRTEFPRFRMNDDREVSCYALLTRHLAGEAVRSEARNAWLAQRDLDEGCKLMAGTLAEAGVFSTDDLWLKTRTAVDAARPRAARAAADLVSPAIGAVVADLYLNPQRWLQLNPPSGSAETAREVPRETRRELATLALMRLASTAPEITAQLLDSGWQRELLPAQAALAWSAAARQAAMKQQPQAADYTRRAWRVAREAPAVPWSDDLLAWQVRSALRLPATEPDRWALISRSLQAMSAAEQRDPAWIYWRARAQMAQAAPGAEGETERAAARTQLAAIASPFNFYGKLALDELGMRVELPAAPKPLEVLEIEATRANPGLARALHLIAIGMRNEGVREWNYSLRGLGERQLLAAAAWACEREVWDRCINTSDRTRGEVDLAQRFPTPFRDAVVAQARDIGLDPAYMYGVIRQESRFIVDTRSHVGASGLMQVMPATARWTAKRIGLPFTGAQINDPDTNLRIGANYLKIVLDDFGGSQALAAAAYNAGPSRSRRWREGAVLEPAAWAESIPFSETRDYVKKVLSNAVVYSALLGAAAPSLKERLGAMIGPRVGAAPERDIP